MASISGILSTKPRFTREDLRDLVASGDGWRLSLFMPLARTGRDVHQAPILLKDLRNEAARILADRQTPLPAREELLGAVDQLLHDCETTVLQGDGLALFASAEEAFAYLLPMAPEASVSLDRRFRVEPLLPLLYEDGRFYLLALGLKGVRLFEGDRTEFAEIPLEGVAVDAKEALGLDDSEQNQGFHNRGASPGAGRAPQYFGHGSGRWDRKEWKKDALRFFQGLDAALKPFLSDPGRSLLLAGSETLLPLYREANTHPRILDVSLPAHLEKVNGLHDLHGRAAMLHESEARAARKALIDRYRERMTTPYSSTGISFIVPLADQGRVSHLFIRRGYRATGLYEPQHGTVQLSDIRQPGDIDLVEFAAIRTLLSGGKVILTEAGEMAEHCAALCRY